jgi:flagellar biosynthesis GTPase FlhF
MKTSFRSLFFAVAAAATVSVAAKGEDLTNCLYNNGLPIPARVCVTLRKVAERDAARQERSRAQQAASVQREQERKGAEQQRQDDYAEQARLRNEREAAGREARAAEAERERAAEEKANARIAKASAERDAGKKAACGDDYKNMRIGMALTRAQECVGKLKLTAQVNRADAVVSTYQGSGMLVNVINGKVVAWAK